jgi:V/A-type H+-transporting ATPase subunit I
MVQAFVACRHEDQDRLLERLRGLGVLHLVPVSAEADDDPRLREALGRLSTALGILGEIEPRGSRPDVGPLDAAREVVTLQRTLEERRMRLDALFRELGRLALWGGVTPEQLEALHEAGVELSVFSVPDRAVGRLRAELLAVLHPLPHRRHLVAAIGLDPESVSARAEPLPPPHRGREAIAEQAGELEKEVKEIGVRLAELAWLVPELEKERERLEGVESWRAAVRGGHTDEALFAVQGWLPATHAPELSRELSGCPVTVALMLREPDPDQRPPTLIRYRWWARPVAALFRMLSMLPGYDEPETSTTFMVALPLFAGMIIGDAGYGLLFIAVPLLLRRRIVHSVGDEAVAMVVLFGCAALLWGAVTGVWFGLTPDQIAGVGGVVGAVGESLVAARLVGGEETAARLLVIKVCFVIGCLHLLTAHGRRLLDFAPDARAFAELGWCVILLAMLGVIWILFFGRELAGADAAQLVLVGLGSGWALVILFSEPSRPLPARLGLGFAGSLLPLLGTFGDTLSYIRLMAVGLASYYLGATFNVLAVEVAEAGTWLAGGVVLIGGHALNIGLILIAIFAHGVRLNVLEFSTNAGVHWTGYPYRPFAERAGGPRPSLREVRS